MKILQNEYRLYYIADKKTNEPLYTENLKILVHENKKLLENYIWLSKKGLKNIKLCAY